MFLVSVENLMMYPNTTRTALAAWLSQLEGDPMHQNVVAWDFWSGHMTGLWVWSQSGCVQEATNCYFPLISRSLSPSTLPLSLSKINEHILSWGLRKKKNQDQ